jgi:hypothetical protein
MKIVEMLRLEPSTGSVSTRHAPAHRVGSFFSQLGYGFSLPAATSLAAMQPPFWFHNSKVGFVAIVLEALPKKASSLI